MSMPLPGKMREELILAGYHEITLKSYTELIAFCRYVFLDEAANNATQLIPNSDPSWDFWRFQDGAVWTNGSYKRSDLSTRAGELLATTCFGKVSRKLCAKPLFTDRGNNFGAPISCDFPAFVGYEIGGVENIYDTSSFDVRHPANPTARTITDLQRQKAELDAREARVLHREAFAQADELRSIAAQYEANGDDRVAFDYRREADALRRRIQYALDAGRPVVRENISVTTLPAPRLLPIRQPALQPATPNKQPVLEIATTGKRSIILDES